MRARALILLHALLGAASVWAEPGSPLEPQFSSVVVPRDVVGSLAQDRAGFLWIGTSDGLARFDGYRLRPIEREGPTAVMRNLGWVRSLTAARDGGMWIGTEVNGLAKYEPERDRVRLLGSVAAQGPHAPIRALAEDRIGRVWVGTLGAGLLLYLPEAKRFEPQQLGGGERRVLALKVGRDGKVWAGHWRGLAVREDSGWRELPLADSALAIYTLLEDREGRIWFGSSDGRLGRVEQGQARWLETRFQGAVQALEQGEDGTIWVGLTDGIAWLDPANGTLRQRLRHDPHLPGTLAGNDVNVLLRDQAGSIWVGGYGVGLQRHRHHPALAVRGPDVDPSSPFASSDLRGLLPRRDGRLLVATHRGPVALLDAELRTLGRWPREQDDPIDTLTEGPDGSIWLVSRGRLERRDPLNARLLRQWPLEGGRAHRVRALADGSIWVGTQDGLFRLAHAEAAQIERMKLSDGEPLRGGVHSLQLEPGSDTLWVGALAGLFRWRGGPIERVEAAPGEALGFPAVLGLLHGRDGTIWVDTAVSGLHRLKAWDGAGRARFERISERLGAPGRPFGVNLHEDAQGRIWSQQSVYDPKADRLDELGSADSASMGTPRFFADAEMPDGRLLFAGSRGLLVVQPQAFSPSRFEPPVVISSLRRNGLPFAPDRLSEGLDLPPGTRSLGVEFAALDYTDPGRLRYQYKLEGWDADWTPTDASARFASYGALKPGRYTLQVRATNHHGMWSSQALRLPIRIRPDWWQTPWAQGLGALAGLGLLVLALGAWVRLRTRQLRRREAALQALVEQRTAELREASLTDTLTGLRNRRYLDLRIAGDLQLCLRHWEGGAPANAEEADLVVLLLDLDHFKRINDQFGHGAGDAVLVQLSERLREVFREADILVRWGGEEFLVLARGTARSGAAELASRVVQSMRSRPFRLKNGQELAVTVSVGFAVFPLDPQAPRAWDWDATLSLADGALYAAKAQGRDGYVGACGAQGLRPEQAPVGLQAWLSETRLQLRRSVPL